MNIGNFVELMGALSLFFAILQTASHRLDFAIKTYRTQSAFLGITMFLSAFYYFAYDLILSAVLTLLIKAMLIPMVLNKIVSTAEDEQVKPFINFTYSILFSTLIVLFSFYSTSSISLNGEFLTQKLLPIGISIIFIGVFLMLARKKALIQIIGFLTLENGIVLSATSTVKGLPIIVEIGVFFDVFVGALMAGVLLYHIKDTFESIDTTKLSDLKE